jgi:hypothetical protein
MSMVYTQTEQKSNQDSACTKSYYMGLTIAEGQKLQCLKNLILKLFTVDSLTHLGKLDHFSVTGK